VVLFVIANKLTTAANAILLQYTAPIYVVLFSPWFLGERASRRDWLTLLVMMGGMVLFFLDELTLDGYLGNIIALVSGLCFAWLTLFLRRQKDGSALSIVIAGQLAGGHDRSAVHVPVHARLSSWIGLSAAGRGAIGVAVYSVRAGAAPCPMAVEGILIPMIEPVLNPVWVFLLMGEQRQSMGDCGWERSSWAR
jgi:drug/metabolite transporter (DMT)-like permease